MLLTLFIIVVMVGLGAFIAYYGDLQGRRWGKKRISKFGLRPKHTAILITSLTGAMISLLSIALVLIIVPPVRDVVLHGERAIEQNEKILTDAVVKRKQYETQSAEAHTEIASKKQLLAAMGSEIVVVKAQLSATEGMLSTKQNELAQTTKQVASLTLETHKLVAQRTQLTAQNSQLLRQNSELTGLNGLLTIQSGELAKQNVDYSRQNVALSKTNHDLNVQNADLNKEKQTLTASNEKLTEANADLDRGNKAYTRVNAVLEGDIERGKLEQSRLVRDNADLEKRSKTQQASINSLYTTAVTAGRNFTEMYNALRQGEISVRVSSEMSRRVIDPNQSAEAVRAQLDQLLAEASSTAMRYGAERGSNDRAVKIVDKQIVTPAGTQNADERASLSALVENISASSVPVVVVASAFNNCIRGEVVPIELTPRKLTRAFEKGTIVATRSIDASKPLPALKEALAEFLQKDVREAALRAGTLPQIDPATGVSQIGQFDSYEIGMLMERIRRLGGKVILKAVAATPTSSADPLDSVHLSLVAERAPDDPSSLPGGS